MKLLHQNKVRRNIYTIVLSSFVAATLYFSLNGYFSEVRQAEAFLKEKLFAIAATSVPLIDPKLHEALANRYAERDAIATNDQDAIYNYLHENLRQIQEQNHLESPIYTLIPNADTSGFVFILTSADEPYFKHEYTEFPEELVQNFTQGGKLSHYKTENGEWISAFVPLKTKEGRTVAIIEVDERFETFKMSALKTFFANIFGALVIVVLILVIMNNNLDKVLKSEEKFKQKLRESFEEIRLVNKNLTDSINYAQYIQSAFLSTSSELKTIVPNSYLFFKGRDKVSGDFPWFFKCDESNTVYIAAVDCTGHGVPGAFLSIIGNFLLNEIVITKNIRDPQEILNELNIGIQNSLSNYRQNNGLNNGMDLAFLKIDYNTNKAYTTNANRPIFKLVNGKVEELKATKISIGGTINDSREKCFEVVEHELVEGMSFHLTSDGFADQFGGPKNKKYLKKRLIEILEKHADRPILHLEVLLENAFNSWKGANEQTDDVLVIGIEPLSLNNSNQA